MHLRNFLIAFRQIALNIATVQTWHDQAECRGWNRAKRKSKRWKKNPSPSAMEGDRRGKHLIDRDPARRRGESHAEFLTNGELLRGAKGRNLLAHVARQQGFRIAVLPQRLRVSACDLARCPCRSLSGTRRRTCRGVSIVTFRPVHGIRSRFWQRSTTTTADPTNTRDRTDDGRTLRGPHRPRSAR